MNRYQYKLIIANKRRTASIAPDMGQIVFKPNPSLKNSFEMFWPNQQLGEVKFGNLVIDDAFMKFLRSGQAPKDSARPEEAYKHWQADDLDFDREDVNQKQYNEINKNLQIAKGSDFYAIQKMSNTGDDKVSIKVKLDTDKKTPLVNAFTQWSQVGYAPGEVQPHLSHFKKIKLSYRDK